MDNHLYQQQQQQGRLLPPQYSDYLKFSGFWAQRANYTVTTRSSSREEMTTEQATERGNVARMVDRLSKDISVTHALQSNPSNNIAPLMGISLRKPPHPLSGNNGQQHHHPHPHHANPGPQRTAIVRYSYTAQQEDELSLKEGDELEVLEDVEEGWARGQVITVVGGGEGLETGKVGLFPTNFVTFATPPSCNTTTFATAALPRLAEEKSPTAITTTSTEGTNGTTTQAEPKPTNNVLPSSTTTATKNNTRRAFSTIMPSGGGGLPLTAEPPFPPPPPPPAQHQRARVMYAYTAANEDELSLPEGAVIRILSKDCEDEGWFEGEYQGRRGLFPENFVKMLDVSPTTTTPSAGAVPHPPPQLPAKPIKPPTGSVEAGHHRTASGGGSQPTPTAQQRDSIVGGGTGTKSPSAQGDERKSVVAGLQSKLFPMGKLPPQKPPPPKFHPAANESGGDGGGMTANLVESPTEGEHAAKLESLTKSRPKQANKRPPSMQGIKAVVTPPTGAEEPLVAAAVPPTLPTTTTTDLHIVIKPKQAQPPPMPSPSSTIGWSMTTKFPAYPPTSTTATAAQLEFIPRQEFESYRSEMNKRVEELAQQVAELQKAVNK